MFTNCLRHLRIFPSQMAFNKTVSTAVLKSQISNGFCWVFFWTPLHSYLKIFLLSLGEFHTMHFHYIHPLSQLLPCLLSFLTSLSTQLWVFFSFFYFLLNKSSLRWSNSLVSDFGVWLTYQGSSDNRSRLFLSQQLSNANSSSALGEILCLPHPISTFRLRFCVTWVYASLVHAVT